LENRGAGETVKRRRRETEVGGAMDSREGTGFDRASFCW